ncbi:acetolactate synthase, small subunit [Mucilaginibacter pineti]|uniref:acetolactate synthase n=1 Tax=Mucilaginibacter pineti TaxID=1391627 RepID=A0A1G7EH47_9SPHI|nr:hypothetical protein [Mucilaginibacter pineti]SDE63000.1 acetolactate synthase, small subunit [Mucilaginibacter pineti]
MKKPATSENQFIFSIHAEDKKGLIGQLLMHFNRSSYDVQSLNVARTDISDLVLITLEACVPEAVIEPFRHKLQKIVEVYAVNFCPANDGLRKVGFYRLAKPALDARLWELMNKFGATLSSIAEHSLVISKTGSDKDLAELYALLEGPHLLGFCKSGLIREESLVPFDAL